MLKLFSITLLIGLALASVDDNEVVDELYYSGVKVYKPERLCSMVGGLCVVKKDCLLLTSNQGLCPLNQHLGVECCYELPKKPAPCKQHLGECMKRCYKELQRPATDCEDGEVCCVLMNK